MERERIFQRFLLLAMAVLAIIFYEGKLCWELIILAAYTGALYGFFAWRCAKPARRIGHPSVWHLFFRDFCGAGIRGCILFRYPQVIVMTVGNPSSAGYARREEEAGRPVWRRGAGSGGFDCLSAPKDVNMAEDETVHAVVDQFGGVLSEKMAVATWRCFSC